MCESTLPHLIPDIVHSQHILSEPMVVPGLFSVFLQSLAELQHLQDTPLSPPCTRHLFGTNRIENMNEFARGLTPALLWRERNIVEPIPGQCPDGSHPTSFSFRVASFHFTTWSYCSYSSWTTNRCSSSDWYRCSAPSAQIRRPCSHKGYAFNVAWDASVGIVVGTVAATDADAGERCAGQSPPGTMEARLPSRVRRAPSNRPRL